MTLARQTSELASVSEQAREPPRNAPVPSTSTFSLLGTESTAPNRRGGRGGIFGDGLIDSDRAEIFLGVDIQIARRLEQFSAQTDMTTPLWTRFSAQKWPPIGNPIGRPL